MQLNKKITEENFNENYEKFQLNRNKENVINEEFLKIVLKEERKLVKITASKINRITDLCNHIFFFEN